MTRRRSRAAAAALALLAAAPLGAQQQPGATPPSGTPRDSTTGRSVFTIPAVTPDVDQARGTDAELRVALFELTTDQYVPALSRLEWLQAAPTTMSGAGAAGALRGREDVSFLLAETYYRLGMDESFRKTAEPLVWTSVGGKYAPLLRSQLLLEAYRRGDYEAAKRLAEAMGGAAAVTTARETGLGALVAGLTAYQTGRFPDARAAFAKAQEGGAPYAAYAQYMDALAQLRADTTQAGATLTALQTLAASAPPEIADQVRLTAAQLAYESGDFAQAATLAASVDANGGLAAQALLTRAWALYKANQIGAAGEAFGEFARRFPELPERDEARLMSAQALLQLGRADEAGRAFRAAADSIAAESGALGGTAAAMRDAARALVAARAAALLFVSDPSSGKTLSLDERAGASDSVLSAVLNEDPTSAPTTGGVALVTGNPRLFTIGDMRARLDSVSGPLGRSFPRRILFTRSTSDANRADFSTRAAALYAADLQVAVARFRLEQQLESQSRQLALLRALQRELADGNAILGPLAAQLAAARDSLTRLASAVDAAGARVQQLFQVQFSETRTLAAENAAAIDSLRTALGGSSSPDDAELLRLERATAATYADLTRQIESGLSGAIARNPVFAQRDSVRAHADRIGKLLGETQTALATAQTLVSQDISRLEASEEQRVARARATLASAESRRASVEAQLVGVVERELAARAGAMLASLRRDTEAAEFGAASAAFFQATDAGRTAGTPGPAGGSAGISTGAGEDVAGAGGTVRPRGEASAGSPSPSTSPRK